MRGLQLAGVGHTSVPAWQETATMPAALWDTDDLRHQAEQAMEADARATCARTTALQLNTHQLARTVQPTRLCAGTNEHDPHPPHYTPAPPQLATHVVVTTWWRIIGPAN